MYKKMNSKPKRACYYKKRQFSCNHVSSARHDSIGNSQIISLFNNADGKEQNKNRRSFNICEKERQLADKDSRIHNLLQQKIYFNEHNRNLIEHLETAINKANAPIQEILDQNRQMRTKIQQLQKQLYQRQLILDLRQQHKQMLKSKHQSENKSQIHQNEEKLPREKICQEYSNRLVIQKSKEGQNQTEQIFERDQPKDEKDEKYEKLQELCKNDGEVVDKFLQLTLGTYFNRSSQPRRTDQQTNKIVQHLMRCQQQLNILREQDKNKQKNIESLKQIIELKIMQRDQLRLEKQHLINQVQELLFVRQQLTIAHEQIQVLHRRLQQKQTEEFEMKNMFQMQRQEISYEIQKIVQEIKQQYGPKLSDSSEAGCKEHKCKMLISALAQLNNARDINKQLLSLLRQKEQKIEILEETLSKQFQRYRHIMMMAKEFDDWFKHFGEQNYLQNSNFYLQSIRNGSFRNALQIKSSEFCVNSSHDSP